jgi:hypothetical protein
MNRSSIVLSLLVVFLLTGSSVAGPPINGIYSSTDMGGPLFLGRYSESFTVPDGSIVPGATVDAQSWNDPDLGTQWRYYCGTMVAPPVLLVDTVNPGTGNGNRTYMKTFVGGYIWLSGTGPWANGDPDYPGIIDSYTIFETITYSNWVRVASVFNVDATAHFDNYVSTCMTFGIGNGSETFSTDWGDSQPANYPLLLEQGTCDPVMTMGSWWDMHTITFQITGCAVPVEESTWGAVKAMYSD